MKGNGKKKIQTYYFDFSDCATTWSSLKSTAYFQTVGDLEINLDFRKKKKKKRREKNINR